MRALDLITGGTGIVGAHVLLDVLRAGGSVRALHRPGSDRSIVGRIFSHHGQHELFARIEWAEGDVMDVSALERAMQGVERLYHAAALVSIDPRLGDAMLRVNVQGTANVVNAALEADVKRLCHVSSTAAIGTPAPGTLGDESLPWEDGKRVSDYSRSKHLAELEVHRGIAEGLDAVIVNPCVVIGPGLSGRSSMTLVDSTGSGGTVISSSVSSGLALQPLGGNILIHSADATGASRSSVECSTDSAVSSMSATTRR